MVNKLALFINHNIFLTKEELEKILNKKLVKVIGASVPVWMNVKTTKTTEPAKEFFCEYEIYYDSEEDEIIKSESGYDIFLKKVDWEKPKTISLEDSLKMTYQERILYEKEIQRLWKSNPEPPNLNRLRSKGIFKKSITELNVTLDEIGNSVIDIQHVLNIKNIKDLNETLC